MGNQSCSIAITTHNRKEDLSVTLEWLQRYREDIVEIIVCADGCTDGTQEFVRESYPEIVLMENTPGRGSIPSRNRMIRAARSELVLLLDDDSYPVEDGFFSAVDCVMRECPEIGALTFPQRSDEFPETLEQKDFGKSQVVATFTSSGTVLRKELFKSLGGFPEMFFHAYEEPDFAVRLHAAGYKVVQWNQLTVRHHFTGAMRDEGRTHRRHARNEFWSTLIRAPWILVIPMLGYRVFSQCRYACRRGFSWVVREPQWWWQAFCGIPEAVKQRKPVDMSSYRSWLRLFRLPKTFMKEDAS
jgi:GT2 family glycosyltransferase